MRYAATIGFFDGVHKGHKYVISRLKADAQAHGLGSAVITFRQHPRQVLQQDFIPKLLTPCNRKIALLRDTGVDRIVDMDFTRELASMSAREFMAYLHEHFSVDRLLIGYDNRFGHNRSDSFDDYVRYGKEIGIEVLCNDALNPNEENISSSVVRRLLTEGEIVKANDCLGYSFGFSGIVVRGYGEGRKLGYPTANMSIDPEQFIPKRGVYAVNVTIEGRDDQFLGMMNIGCRPTYGEFKETVEVNILDFNEDIYDKEITVKFIERIRDEKKFNSLDELKGQLAKDRIKIENGEWKTPKG